MDMHNSAYKILLVDDDEDEYIVTRDLLQEAEQAAFELTWVNTYQAGRDALYADLHDVYLVDYRLEDVLKVGIAVKKPTQCRLVM